MTPNYATAIESDTVELPTWAVNAIIDWTIEGSELDYAHPDDEIIQAMTEVWTTVKDVDYLCEMCTRPTEATHTSGDLYVCPNHAEDLDAGHYDGQPLEDVEPIEGME